MEGSAGPPPPPRYRRLADEWTADIASGRHPVGSMLPTEAELCAAHRVSRHTVREALRVLEERGLVARRQGSGTTVLAERPGRRFVQDISDLQELLQYPRETRLTVLRARRAQPEGRAAEALGAAPGEAWLRVEGIRRVRVTEPPICFATVHIRPEHASALEEVGATPEPIHAVIARRFGIEPGGVEVEIAACQVPPEQAGALEVEAGSPGLLIRRLYLERGGRAFELSEAVHPAPRFTYRLSLKRR